MTTPPTDRSDDAVLVAAAQAGDRQALDRLLRRHYDRMYAVCRRITGHHADAADAAQEAMIAVVRGLDRFDGRSSFGTWAYRIATNASLDELRRRRRRPMVSPDRHDLDRPAGPSEVNDPRATERTDALPDRILIDAALAALPDEFRLPVVLRDVADLDYSQIAEVLDIPLGTVKSRIARGRSQLAALLDGNQSEHPERQTGTP